MTMGRIVIGFCIYVATVTVIVLANEWLVACLILETCK